MMPIESYSTSSFAKNITKKTLLTLINKDLRLITETLKLPSFRSESLKISAIYFFWEEFSESKVLEEFFVSKTFLKRIELLYEINS